MGQLFSVKPLLFHEVHGNGIELSENRSSARCVKICDSNITFSLYPIKTNQKIHVKLTNISNESHDVISIGFTCHDPSNLRHNLPKCKNHQLEVEPGYWMCTLSKYYCFENTVLHFCFDENGNLKYGSFDKERRSTNVKVEKCKFLWAVIHIWSAPTAITLLDSAALTNIDPNLCKISRNLKDEVILAKKDASIATIRQQNEDNSSCAICYENCTGAALFPCGHLCMCYECACMQWRGEGDGTCPMCRAPILNILKIYKS